MSESAPGNAPIAEVGTGPNFSDFPTNQDFKNPLIQAVKSLFLYPNV
jgi:hypothetical protein